MDRIAAMQTFVRVVETGSFSAVAREQNATQSAVSKQVSALERRLGAKLLTRTTRSLALTDDGARYFEHARRLVAEVLEAEGSLRRGEQQLSGWMRVAAPVGYGVRVLMPHVHAFLAAHPCVKIDLKFNDGFVDLVEQGIDLAVRIGHLSDSTLVARRIGTVRPRAITSRRYLDALPPDRPPPRVPGDLLHHPCIVFTERRARNVWEFTSPQGESVTVAVSGPVQSNTSEVIRAAVLAGQGISYSGDWMFRDALDSGEVCELLTDWPAPLLPISLVCPPERRHAAKVRAFSDYLAAVLAPQ